MRGETERNEVNRTCGEDGRHCDSSLLLTRPDSRSRMLMSVFFRMVRIVQRHWRKRRATTQMYTLELWSALAVPASAEKENWTVGTTPTRREMARIPWKY